MDINNLASFMMLEPSQLMRAERFVEQGLGMYDQDEELTENYLKEHLGGATLEYAMHLLGESTTSYMGVQIHNQGGKFSAPTAGVYGSASRPELKKKIKEKILKRNERENAAEKLKTKKEEVEVQESAEDRLRDRRMERGGVDGNTNYRRPPSTATGPKKKPSGNSMSAFDKVVGDLKKKYGDSAIRAKKTVREKLEEYLEEKKMSKAAHKKAAKAGKRWQDSDGDGKWYEPGQDVKKEELDSEMLEQFNLLKDYLFENEIASTEEDVLEVFENITDEELDYCLEQAMVQLKGKKKGNVVINPEVKKVNENADQAKKMQIQRRQLMLNKQKVALQQKATSKKTSTDMHVEENLQEVDVTTRANNFGAEIERTNVRQKKEKKSLKDFKKLSMGGKTTTEELAVEADMSNAPSIKDAKPAKKTTVKKYKGLGYAPTIAKEESEIDEATYPSDFKNGVAKKKSGGPKQHDQPMSGGRRKTVDEGLKQARKNVGADKCWSGYEAKGTKMKGGKQVPNCVKKTK